MEGDPDGDTGTGEGARCYDGIVEFNVMGGVLASEAHGVNGNVASAEGADGVGADAPGIIVTIAEEHHGADGQVGSFIAQLLEAVANASGGCVGLQILEGVDAGGHCVDAIKAGLKRPVEIGQDSVLQGVDGLSLAGDAVLGYSHAARIVDQHGDDVLLRLQLGDGDRGLPQQDQHERSQEGLQSPDDPGSPTAHDGRGFGHASADEPGQTGGRDQDQQHQYPLRPCAQESELAACIDGARILKKEFEHGVVGRWWIVRMPNGSWRK